MNYELALELKNNGFPMNKSRKIDAIGTENDHQTGEMYAPEEIEDSVLFPILSELIEACGDRLRKIKHSPKNKKFPWIVQGFGNVETVDGRKMAEKDIKIANISLEVAVAVLWLEINKIK